ncbi:MAG TPA: hypothetical protein PK110_08220 [Niabella sp.]|nr:hypothetical protein [Chitinophagaceae bacterium]HRO84789.1 hypothetical protein [Niabella sp.]
MKNKFICLAMIKYIFKFVFIVLIMGTSCSYHSRSFSNGQMKKIYIKQFKLTYIRMLLLKGYNYSDAVKEIIGKDNSGFAEPILFEEDYHLIDSFTTIDNDKMKLDSIEGIDRAEGAQGKRPLGYLIDIMKSKFLDSLSKSQYKINKKKI